jgi:NAD(P)-dependent dehydrogenase (short-subunit alcohol dehydrogenase family)
MNMNPRPDHGETSYRGSGRLAGRKALITGGDSGMGRAAAIAYAREGADVAINHLSEEARDAREVIALIQVAERIALDLPGDIRDEAFCNRFQGHPRQWRRAGADLDTAAREQRGDRGQDSRIRRQDVAWARSAVGACLDLRPARCRRRELRDRPDLRLVRRRRHAVAA